ncbi:MAG TPA: hypothetical protein VKE74_16720 [Gemmataceae bacterium]|nr:hypothetical protein [Gemmataceae bacterium]
MRTVLDEANTWFFHALVHRDEKLQVIVAEGIKAAEPEDLVIGTTNLGPSWRVEVTDKSRWVCVSFARVCAYQAINESLTSADDYEVFDRGFLRVYERSRYLDFLRAHAIMEHPMAERARHYCVLTEDHIIDVVAVGEPEFEFLQPPAG